jgi:hypothetical protein
MAENEPKRAWGERPPKRAHKATKASPTKNSKRSKRRAARGFTSLERDSRKHRRALARHNRSRTIAGVLMEPGETRGHPGPSGFSCRAGGAYN